MLKFSKLASWLLQTWIQIKTWSFAPNSWTWDLRGWVHISEQWHSLYWGSKHTCYKHSRAFYWSAMIQCDFAAPWESCWLYGPRSTRIETALPVSRVLHPRNRLGCYAKCCKVLHIAARNKRPNQWITNSGVVRVTRLKNVGKYNKNQQHIGNM